ncbi:hypothetical protein ACIXWW_16485 [Bacteroides fragilis]
MAGVTFRQIPSITVASASIPRAWFRSCNRMAAMFPMAATGKCPRCILG